MRKIHYHKLNPGGNITALVSETIPRDIYSPLAKMIMKSDPEIEQVGYIEKPQSANVAFRLQMMGGEFCANAARCAAFFWTQEKPQSPVKFEVSGTDHMVSAEINRNKVCVILPADFFKQIYGNNPITVDLEGIRHVIHDKNNYQGLTPPDFSIYKEQCPYGALGILFIKTNHDIIDLDPYVWVRDTETYIHETGCGSGSIAVAVSIYKSDKKRKEFQIRQPSKKIYHVAISEMNGKLKDIKFFGAVEYVKEDVVDCP